jgi:hypothetical protein
MKCITKDKEETLKGGHDHDDYEVEDGQRGPSGGDLERA